MKNLMKSLIYIIIFLVVIISSGCTETTKRVNFYEAFIECPNVPAPLRLVKIEKNGDHIGSVEKQKILLTYMNLLEKYLEDMEAVVSCYQKQIKKGINNGNPTKN